MIIIKYLLITFFCIYSFSVSAQDSSPAALDTIIIDYKARGTFYINIECENLSAVRTGEKVFSFSKNAFYYDKIEYDNKELNPLEFDHNYEDSTRITISGNNITKIGLFTMGICSYHINLSKCNNLIELENNKCQNNLSSIGHTKLKTLKILNIAGYNEELDLTNYLALEQLYIFYSDIDKIDLSNNKHLDSLQLICTNINSLDLSQNKPLSYVLLRENPFTPTGIKNMLESLPQNYTNTNTNKTIRVNSGISICRDKGLIYNNKESVEFNFSILEEKGWSLKLQ